MRQRTYFLPVGCDGDDDDDDNDNDCDYDYYGDDDT
jgi:hypothetical protein